MCRRSSRGHQEKSGGQEIRLSSMSNELSIGLGSCKDYCIFKKSLNRLMKISLFLKMNE